MKVEFDLLKLLSSRLCHDIISPVNSLNFSISIIKEEKDQSAKEAFDIANTSVNNLINRLTYFRIALGAASVGSEQSALKKTKELIVNLFQEKDVKMDWNKDIDDNLLKVASNDNMKLLLNLFLIIFYSVGKSATVSVYSKYIDDTTIGFALSVKGAGIKLGIDNIQALRLEIKEKDITPRNVQSYFTAILANDIDADLQVRDNMQEEIQIAFKLQLI